MIVCLPGFLGLPSDWDFLPFSHTSLDLFNDPTAPSPLSLWGDYLENQFREDEEKILIGYSLGGRLVLNALVQKPDSFSKAIIISAHTGLQFEEEKRARLQSDSQWSTRFNTQRWEDVLSDWNSQSVFNGFEVKRDKNDFNMSLLSKGLHDWSLGNQSDLISQLSIIKSKVLWIVGEHDQKFIQIAEKAISHLQNGTLFVCPHAGHRVPWQKTTEFCAALKSFI